MLLFIPVSFLVPGAKRRAAQREHPLCRACRYPLASLAADTCPECGAELRRVGVVGIQQGLPISRGPVLFLWVIFLVPALFALRGWAKSNLPHETVTTKLIQLNREEPTAGAPGMKMMVLLRWVERFPSREAQMQAPYPAGAFFLMQKVQSHAFVGAHTMSSVPEMSHLESASFAYGVNAPGLDADWLAPPNALMVVEDGRPASSRAALSRWLAEHQVLADAPDPALIEADLQAFAGGLRNGHLYLAVTGWGAMDGADARVSRPVRGYQVMADGVTVALFGLGVYLGWRWACLLGARPGARPGGRR